MISNEEKIIINGIRNKNEDSLKELIKLYGKLVKYVASSVLKEDYLKSYSEDVYNEVFNTIWFNMDCFDEGYGNFKGWVISITKFKALDLRKKLYKDSLKMEFVEEITEDYKEKNEGEYDTNDLVLTILENLEEKDKIIFIKRYLEGYGIKEISKEMGYSENYIHTRVSRSRKKLKKMKVEGLI